MQPMHFILLFRSVISDLNMSSTRGYDADHLIELENDLSEDGYDNDENMDSNHYSASRQLQCWGRNEIDRRCYDSWTTSRIISMTRRAKRWGGVSDEVIFSVGNGIFCWYEDYFNMSIGNNSVHPRWFILHATKPISWKSRNLVAGLILTHSFSWQLWCHKIAWYVIPSSTIILL